MDKLKGMKCIGWMSARWRDAAVCFLLFPALSLLAVVEVDNPLLPQDDMAAQWDRMGRVVPAVLAYVCFLLWIARNCRSLHGRMSEVLSWAVMLAAGWQAVLGLLQIYGFEASKHSGYAMTGSFFNPGPYAGFLAVAFPLAADFWFRKSENNTRRVLNMAAVCIALLVLCVLPATRSRAAWLAAGCAGLMLVGMHRYREYMKYTVMAVVAAGILGAVGTSLFKQDSAGGRLLIWKVCTQAIKDRPLTGHDGNFGGVYGRYQEDYFASGRASDKEKWVAGAPEYAFNEYIQAMVERGVPLTLSVCLLFALLGYVACKGNDYGTACAGVALAVFAFFSYPLHFPGFWAVMLLLCIKAGLAWRGKGRIGLTVCIMACFMIYVSRQSAELSGWKDFYEKWSDSRLLYRYQLYDDAADAYRQCAETEYGKKPVDFWFEYGHALYKSGKYEEAVGVLKRAEQLSADAMILNIIGECYEKWSEKENHLLLAEHYYRRSLNRLPERIYPYYLLAKLYASPGWEKKEQMREMARMVLTKKPKVPSPAVEEMKKEMKELLEKYKDASHVKMKKEEHNLLKQAYISL